MSNQNVDPYADLLARPSGLTHFKMNAPGLTQKERAELRVQYEAQLGAELAPPKPVVTAAGALAAIKSKRDLAQSYVDRADEAIAAHAPAGSLTAAVDEIADEDEFGTYDEDDE